MAVLVARIPDGSDVLESLRTFARQNDIREGEFVAGSGRIANFEVTSFEKRGSIAQKKVDSAQDILAVSGKILQARGEVTVQLNVSLGRPGLTPVQGLLARGKSAGDTEISVRKYETGKIIYA